MFLQPRKFGKTLFTSTLEYYYDIKAKDKFEKLYGETYIGKNPTALKNSYHILRFNFSGIDTSSVEATIKGFKNEVASSINGFAVRYGLDFFVNNNDEAENILNNLFKAFYLQKTNEKIYVIIDEYDHFANELLGFHTEQFKELVSKNGIIRITVWDYNGNSTKELVKIENIDRSRPKVESINYSDPDENGKVNVTIVANEKITAMSNENELAQGWINLSDNTIQKVYDESELTGAGTKEKL